MVVVNPWEGWEQAVWRQIAGQQLTIVTEHVLDGITLSVHLTSAHRGIKFRTLAVSDGLV